MAAVAIGVEPRSLLSTSYIDHITRLSVKLMLLQGYHLGLASPRYQANLKIYNIGEYSTPPKTWPRRPAE